MTRVCNTSNNSMVIHLKPDPTLKVILKYHKHPRILTIKEKCKSNSRFSFSYENRNQDTPKASQDNDIQPVIKENADNFSFITLQSFNHMIDIPIIPSAKIEPVFKKGLKKDQKIQRQIIGLQVSYLMPEKFTKGFLFS